MTSPPGKRSANRMRPHCVVEGSVAAPVETAVQTIDKVYTGACFVLGTTPVIPVNDECTNKLPYEAAESPSYTTGQLVSIKSADRTFGGAYAWIQQAVNRLSTFRIQLQTALQHEVTSYL